MQNDSPRRTIDDNRIVVGDEASDTGESGGKWDIEISSDDRRVRGLATCFESKSNDVLADQSYRFGGRQVVRNDDDLLAHFGQIMVGDALQGSQKMPNDIAKIITPRTKALIVEPFELPGQLLSFLVNGPFRVDSLIADSSLDSRQERGVGKQ